MGFTRFVEIGRVAYVAFGPDEGKLVAILDIIDQNKVLVDGPCSGVARKAINLKQLHLTKFMIQLGPSARSKAVKKAWEKAEINQKWAETTWSKKLEARQKRNQLNDFDRFKLMKAKQARNRLITIGAGKLRKQLKANPPKAKRTNKKPSKK
uniref:Large ribosomal subunit protein eL14 n=1 Tax=Sipunculus nudus TaxID=6446 RepID=A8U9R2_SIPNU|nr:putative ribosomal protein L14 [Sipunculus nudus]